MKKEIKSISISDTIQLTRRLFYRKHWSKQGIVSVSGLNKTEQKLFQSFPKNKWVLIKVNEK